MSDRDDAGLRAQDPEAGVGAQQRVVDGAPARKRLGKAFGNTRSPRMGEFAQRARETAQERLAAARKNQIMECLIRAEQIRTPDLVNRGYKNLTELAAAADDVAAAQWRAAAAQVADQ